MATTSSETGPWWRDGRLDRDSSTLELGAERIGEPVSCEYVHCRWPASMAIAAGDAAVRSSNSRWTVVRSG